MIGSQKNSLDFTLGALVSLCFSQCENSDILNAVLGLYINAPDKYCIVLI